MMGHARLAAVLASLPSVAAYRATLPEPMLNSDVSEPAASALLQEAQGQEGPIYRIDMIRMLRGYQKTFCGLSEDGCQTLKGYPGSDALNYLSWEQAVNHLLEVPRLQEEGKIWRGNELGYLILNDGLWARDYKTIGLGVTVEQHKYFRPIADAYLGSAGEGKHWSEEMIDAHLVQFMRGRNTMSNLKQWTTPLMHKLHLDIDLSPENVTRFMAFQNSAVMNAVLPVCIGCNGIRDTRDAFFNELYIPAIKRDARDVFPKNIDAEHLRLIASSLMDSMLFAGGLSVSFLIRTALCVLYADPSIWEAEDKQITDENVDQFVWEMIRRFPAVFGFPWYTMPGKKQHVIVNVATPLRDVRVWNASGGVLDFKLRPLELYEKYGRIAWAEPANGPAAWAVPKPGRTGNLTPMSRGCPGQALSFTIIKAFMKRWAKTWKEWHVVDAPKGGLVFNDAGNFVGDMTIAKIIKVGPITTVSKSFFSYTGHKRWAVLTAGDADYPATLLVFESKNYRKDDPSRAVEKIVLGKGNVKVQQRENWIAKVDKEAECFKIKGDDDLRLCGTNAAERDAWMAAIRQALAGPAPA